MKKQMSEGQRAYEAKRAAKAGVSLEKWIAQKSRDQDAAARPPEPPREPKKPNFFSRMLDRAHKPI